MKVISFSAVEILPALLDRSKTQTLRPAWKEDAYLRCNDISKEINPNKYFKEPRFKVGEKVKLMWKCRSPYKYFSPDDGRGVLKLKDGNFAPSKNISPAEIIKIKMSAIVSGFPAGAARGASFTGPFSAPFLIILVFFADIINLIKYCYLSITNTLHLFIFYSRRY